MTVTFNQKKKIHKTKKCQHDKNQKPKLIIIRILGLKKAANVIRHVMFMRQLLNWPLIISWHCAKRNQDVTMSVDPYQFSTTSSNTEGFDPVFAFCFHNKPHNVTSATTRWRLRWRPTWLNIYKMQQRAGTQHSGQTSFECPTSLNPICFQTKLCGYKQG